MKKTCTKCSVEKETSEFYKSNANRKHKLGVYSICKECCRKSSKKKYKENPEHRKEIQEKYFAKNPRARENTRLKHKYGMTLDDYEEMYDLSNGKCNICDRKEKRLHIDHCHKINKVRGLLCAHCNRGLGSFFDKKESLLEAVKYLKRG